MSEQFDVVVIGGGPAGYAAAIRAAQLGLATACIDKSLGKDGKPAFGGTCLNWGCIPSKALLDASHKYIEAAQHLGDVGIEVAGVSMDVPKMIDPQGQSGGGPHRRHRGAVQGQRRHRAAGSGAAAVRPPGRTHAAHDGDGEHAAGGARGAGAGVGARAVFRPHRWMAMRSWTPPVRPGIPGSAEVRLGVIGAGVIGLELGSVWGRLGSEVVILEALPDFLPMADARIARDALKVLRGQGLDVRLETLVTGSKIGGNGVTVTYEDTRRAAVD